MAMPLFNCHICTAETPHQIVRVHDHLPPHVQVVECTGCGVLSVKSIYTQPVDNSE